MFGRQGIFRMEWKRLTGGFITTPAPAMCVIRDQCMVVASARLHEGVGLAAISLCM